MCRLSETPFSQKTQFKKKLEERGEEKEDTVGRLEMGEKGGGEKKEEPRGEIDALHTNAGEPSEDRGA